MAVDNSALRAALSQDPGFLARLATFMCKIAVEVTVESGATENHEARLDYAQGVLREPNTHATRAAGFVLQQTNFLNGTIEIVPEGNRNFSVRISTVDADAESQVRTNWDDMAELFT